MASGFPTMSLRPTITTRAGDLHAVPLEQQLHSLGRTGQEPRSALHQPPNIFRMERVDVLHRADGTDDARQRDLFGQGQLNKNAVDLAVLVQFGDER